MSSIPTNDASLPANANPHPSLSLTPRQYHPQHTAIPTLSHGSLLSHVLGNFSVDAPVVSPPEIPSSSSTLVHRVNSPARRHLKRRPRYHVMPGDRTIQQFPIQVSARNTLPPATPILDGSYALFSHPLSSADTTVAPSSSAMFRSGMPRYTFRPDAISQVSSHTVDFNTPAPAPPRPFGQPAIAPQLPFDQGASQNACALLTYSAPSVPASGSHSVLVQTVPAAMTSGPAMAPTSAPAPLTWTGAVNAPGSSSSTDGTLVPVVRPWVVADATAPAADAAAAPSTARAGPESARASRSRCSCCKRVHPLVRVDNTVEWVRPDVMKMVLWFNWSSDAEAEALVSWEPRARGTSC
ncbi:hypothetical protein F5148DRAFT_1150234 [Russula earlei]|uniref:Uncharacterized protein n=1 Tax=Russula earlei TaxID=71964 RepID=A0ACC0U4Y5_9AGAM|nr:hypothetical protein F5148DRAFT_1150234 [Russula earlei]